MCPLATRMTANTAPRERARQTWCTPPFSTAWLRLTVALPPHRLAAAQICRQHPAQLHRAVASVRQAV